MFSVYVQRVVVVVVMHSFSKSTVRAPTTSSIAITAATATRAAAATTTTSNTRATSSSSSSLSLPPPCCLPQSHNALPISKPYHYHLFHPLKPKCFLLPPPPTLSFSSSSSCIGFIPSNVLQSFEKTPQRNPPSSSSSSSSSSCFQHHNNRNNIHSLLHHLLLTASSSSCFLPSVLSGVHCLAIKTGGLPSHLPIATALVTLYSRAGHFPFSLSLFREISRYYCKDVILSNATLTASLHNRRFAFALHFFRSMINDDDGRRAFDSTSLLLAVSAVSNLHQPRPMLILGRSLHALSFKCGFLSHSNLCNALIDMYAKCRDLTSSQNVFASMNNSIDVVSWNSIMTGCLRNHHPHKTLSYFSDMTRTTDGSQRPDHVSLSCAIAASSSLGQTSLGGAIYALGFKLGFNEDDHISVANSLISFYSRSGEVEVAETIFKRMATKDVVSCNAMIDAFASNGMIWHSFHLLYEMQNTTGLHPDNATIASITPLCSQPMLLREGRTIHGYVIRRGMESDLALTNSLIDMYLKCNSLSRAKILFDVTVPRGDAVSWNVMISWYSRNGLPEEAQALFKKMLRCSCLNCTLSTLLAILPSCAVPQALWFGKSLHCWQLKLGFSDDVLAVNSLMHMYIYCGDLVAAFSLFQRNSLIAEDTACWNTIIAGCTRNCRFLEALETFYLMRREANLSPDSITLVSVISVCGSLELLTAGKSLHSLALKSLAGLDTRVQNATITMYGRCGDIESATSVFWLVSGRNLCSWNCMISALSHNNAGRQALELFHCLELEPNEITIVGILSACTQLGLLRNGKQIHCYTLRRGLQNNSFISAALLDMYSNCGMLDIAIRLFRDLEEKTVDTWNSMISAYGYHGNGRKAIDSFHEMFKSGLRATKSTFVSLLSACSHSGIVDEGIRYYNSMLEDYGVEPVADHHVCVVDMLGRTGRLQEAFEFINHMHTPPEPGVWGALLSACNYHGDLEMGREVGAVLFKLDPANVGYCISLSNTYVAAGRWEEALQLREIVDGKQLKKPTGYSRITISAGVG